PGVRMRADVGRVERSGGARRRVAPHVRVAIVAVVLLAAGVLFLALTLRWLNEVQEPVDVATTSVQPAAAELRQLTVGLGRVQYLFDSAMLEADPVVRVGHIEELRAQRSVNEEAWRAFRSASVDLPGEAALIADYEAAAARQDDLAGVVGYALVLADDPAGLVRDDDVVSLLAAQADAQEAVAGLTSDVYDARLRTELASAAAAVDATRSRLLALFAALAMVVGAMSVVAIRSAWREDRRQRGEQRRRAAEARRNEFEARLYRALQMATGESFAYEVVAQALRETLPTARAELLVADSAEAPFRRTLRSDQRDRGAGCRVAGPSHCPSAQRGDRLVFTSATDLDACPYLRERAPSDGTLSAVCQPVAIAGRSLGVIHATTRDGVPSDEALSALDLIGRRSGDRIALLRVMAETESQARTDPLTGLLNRRSLEAKVRELEAAERGYCVAYGDLDHFKALNDTHGHEAGDRALLRFAELLVACIRPDDLACRFGGEEFVVVLPDCELDEAAAVMERVRVSLSDARIPDDEPPMTVSFGVASSAQAESFSRVVALADGALLRAKSSGRDRVVTATPLALPGGDRTVGEVSSGS
ncbi:MAG: GGDEF domain-containing protein, partial [Acidimicrobiia bacterium]|nr:GGDEF domain-containing protein [Acidimicrobiia bacterium]